MKTLPVQPDSLFQESRPASKTRPAGQRHGRCETSSEYPVNTRDRKIRRDRFLTAPVSKVLPAYHQ